MIRFRAPRQDELDRRIRTARELPLSHREEVQGSSWRREIPADYSAGEWEIALGRGGELFEAACAALSRFEHFPRELVTVHPSSTPPAPGGIVALHARAGPIHADLACRIGAVVEESVGEGDERVRFRGFHYATIEGHVERGEERFTIEHRAGDDSVVYRIRALSRPAHPLAWFAQPWVRSLQRRFGRLSGAALRRACGAETDLPPPREIAHRPPCGLPWLGAAAFAAVSIAVAPPLADLLISFAALALLPAARALLPGSWNWIRGWSASSIWFGSALLLSIAPALPRGELAAAVAAPWLFATLIAAGRAAHAHLRAGRREPADSGAVAGLLLLPVGALWALFAHLGRWPGGFPPPVPELTAAHFHYAGCIAPIILSRAAAAHSPRLAAPFAIAWVAGMSAVAIGITLAPAIEVASALALISLAAAGGVLQLRAALRSGSRLGSFLLASGSLALLAGLGLAGAYSVLEHQGGLRGEAAYSGGGILPWQRMLPWHGLTMAIGFALASVLGWDAARECSRPVEPLRARAGSG